MRTERMTETEAYSSPQGAGRPDLGKYRQSASEQTRINSLFKLMPLEGNTALDIGARDGYLSHRLTERFTRVTALDLEKPTIVHPAIQCVGGDARSLDFADNSMDLVLCSEVLEHIPATVLPKVCDEIFRVAKEYVLIGVPFDQDIRVGRTTCRICGGKNPPWGHVNAFTERKLRLLFPEARVAGIDFVGENRQRTNALSALLLDWGGNPFGTYDQEEPCIHCNSKLRLPAPRSLPQRAASFLGVKLMRTQSLCARTRPNWIHILFRKTGR